MPVYRYQSASISQGQLSEQVPGAPVLGSTGPAIYVDVTAPSGSKADLDEYMASVGFPTFVATDPTTTPTQASSAQFSPAQIPFVGVDRAVRVATTTTLAALQGLLVVDTVQTAAGDRVLVKNQNLGSENGIYVAAAGAWTLASDWATGAVVAEMLVQVSEGTQQHTLWALSTQGAITVGSTALTFTQFTGGATVPGGSAGQVQYNGAGAFVGAVRLTVDAGGYPTLGEASTVNPAVPAAGATVFAKLRAGRRMAAQIGPSGVSYTMQPSLWGNKIGWWSAIGNSTTVSSIGINNVTTGTATTRSVAITTFATSLRQVAFVSASSAGSSAGTRHGAAQFYSGDAAGRGGYFYVARFVIDTIAAGMRWFVGLLNGTLVIGNVNPSTLLNMVGFGIDAGQTTVRFFNNDAAGTATAADMGASFPATTAGVVYEVRIFCPPNGGTISYSIERLDSAALAEGSVAADIPASTTLLSPQMWVNNGATVAAVALSVVTQYIETDN